LIAPPYIPVPPVRYGGTELFVAQLASGLKRQGVEVVVYANGESHPDAELRFLYEKGDWPLPQELDVYKDINHCAWAMRDAIETCDIMHLNSAPALALSRFLKEPMVYTIHHPHVPKLHDFYSYYPDAFYVAISDFQRKQHSLPICSTIYHGIDTAMYKLVEKKQQYLSFLGRIAPVKGAHTAIEVAKRTGIPLKLAGEVQPIYKDYFETQIKPHIDGKFIEYIGEADLAAKNELLGDSLALLFPIHWDEPFGLVMVEAMACGTPVLAFNGGSVPEIVRDGVSGYVCRDIDDMVARAKSLSLPAAQVRAYAEQRFSVDRMAEEYARLYREILSSDQRTHEDIAQAARSNDDVENTAA